jgi:hypothetical protein
MRARVFARRQLAEATGQIGQMWLTRLRADTREKQSKHAYNYSDAVVSFEEETNTATPDFRTAAM